MACIPDNKAFTPCQMAALRAMTPDQQKDFARAVGLSHALNDFQKNNPLDKTNPIPVTNLGFSGAILPTVENMATIIKPGSRKNG